MPHRPARKWRALALSLTHLLHLAHRAPPSAYKKAPEPSRPTAPLPPLSLTPYTSLHHQEGGSTAAVASGRGARARQRSAAAEVDDGHAALFFLSASHLPNFSSHTSRSRAVVSLSRFCPGTRRRGGYLVLDPKLAVDDLDVPEPYNSANRPCQTSAVARTHSTVPGNPR